MMVAMTHPEQSTETSDIGTPDDQPVEPTEPATKTVTTETVTTETVTRPDA